MSLASTRPNIVLILADQLRADILGAYGGSICSTPHIDELARESVVFDRAYTPLAVCSPARASILTGRYPHNHGVIGNQSQTANGTISDGPDLLSRRLEALGYDRWYIGKWHLGGDERLPKDVGLPGQQFPGHGGGGYHYPEYKDYLARKGLEFTFRDGPHALGWHSYGTLAGPDEVETSWFLADEAIRFLEGRAGKERAGGDNPFFLWVNFWGPHEPYFVPESYVRLYDGVEIPPWPNFPDDASDKPRVHRLKVPPESRSLGWAFWEPAVRHYFAFTSYVDHQVGRILRRLDELGLRENTVVIFAADHGESIGAHGCQDKGHFMYEEIYRIPFMMRIPGRGPNRTGALISLVDLCPTLLEIAGDAAPEQGRDGRSLRPLLDDPSTPWRESVVAEFHGLVAPFTQRMAVDRRYKYVWNMGDLDELYDLEADPYELKNLIDVPELRDVRRRLQRELLAWMAETKDSCMPYFRRHAEAAPVAERLPRPNEPEYVVPAEE